MVFPLPYPWNRHLLDLGAFQAMLWFRHDDD